MKTRLRENYGHTLYASYTGYIVQAVVNNFVPLLFLTFQTSFGISLEKISLLVSLNFGIQLIVDLLAAKWIDQIGYRRAVVCAHVFSAAGLLGLAFLPDMFAEPYVGIALAIGCYAIGGGLIEVLISPIVEGCPTDKKEAAMSLLHSFYCWGHVFVVICSTLFFTLLGTENWRILSCIWAVIPFLNGIYFMLVPIPVLVEEHERIPLRTLAGNKIFWILLFMMVCAGASEQGMSQWASAFAESGLNISKTVGDLAGPCMFAVFMGMARAGYAKYSERINLKTFMTASTILCVLSYMLAALSKSPVFGLIGCGLCGLSVGILWPGTFSMAAKHLLKGGTAMYALMALAGDLGCSAGPALVGFVSEAFGENLQMGLLAAIVFPVVLVFGIEAVKRLERAKAKLTEY